MSYKHWMNTQLAAGESSDQLILFNEGSGWYLRARDSSGNIHIVLEGTQFDSDGVVVSRGAFAVSDGIGSEYTTLMTGSASYTYQLMARVCNPTGGALDFELFVADNEAGPPT